MFFSIHVLLTFHAITITKRIWGVGCGGMGCFCQNKKSHFMFVRVNKANRVHVWGGYKINHFMFYSPLPYPTFLEKNPGMW